MLMTINRMLDNTQEKVLYTESGNDVPKGICKYYGTAKGCIRKFGVCPYRHLDDVDGKLFVSFLVAETIPR